MLSKLRVVFIISYLISCINVVYGNEINKIDDLLDEDISLSDKLEYLESIKNNSNNSFSDEDINILVRTFGKNAEWLELYQDVDNEDDEDDENDGEEWKKREEISPSDMKLIHKIRSYVLEILLQDSVNEENLTLSQMTVIASSVAMEEVYYSDKEIDEDSKIRRYLALKLLIKINELRPNTDDEISKSVRNIRFDEFESSSFIDDFSNKMNDFIRFMMQGKDSKDWGIIEVNAENMEAFLQHEENDKDSDNDEVDEDKVDYINKSDIVSAFKTMFFDNDGNTWDMRDRVEKYIFDPILLELGLSYVEKDEKVLLDYEKYLLSHIKFFPITDNLKELIEKSFFKTKFKELKSKYIDAMSFLDMRDSLLKIILDTSIDIELRKQAIDLSVKLLSKVDTLYFREFSLSLLNNLEKIFSDLEEVEELRKIAEEKISLVKESIDKHFLLKDLESVVFSINISSK